MTSFFINIKIDKEKEIVVPSVVAKYLVELKEATKDKKKKRKNTKLIDTLKPPKVYFGPITRYGDMSLLFDQNMIVPPLKDGKIDQDLYQQIFNVRIISAMDYTIVDGKFKQDQKTKRKLFENESLDEEIELTQTEKDLQFGVQITKHVPKEIMFKINLKNPALVSSSAFGMDRVSVQLKNPSVFVSEETGMQIDMSDFLQGVPEINKEILP